MAAGLFPSAPLDVSPVPEPAESLPRAKDRIATTKPNAAAVSNTFLLFIMSLSFKTSADVALQDLELWRIDRRRSASVNPRGKNQFARKPVKRLL
jgi:hypothetical protein